MDHPATAYPLKTIQDASEAVETSPGLRCRLRDISEDGAALMVGGVVVDTVGAAEGA